jgi:hypothetical protein
MALGSQAYLASSAARRPSENGELRLLDRRDGVVDCETGLPFQPIGAVCGALGIAFVLLLGDVGLQVVHVVGNLCLHGGPISGRRVVCRLDFLIDLFDRLGGCGVRLFLARRDLVVGFLLGRV